TKAEGGAGYCQGVVAVGNDDGNIGGHARLEFQFRVVDLDDRDVGHDTDIVFRGVADLRHLAIKDLTGESIHVEFDVLAHRHQANVRLRHVRFDLHLGQIVGDDEQSGCAEAGGDGLTDIDIPGNDNPIDWGVN